MVEIKLNSKAEAILGKNWPWRDVQTDEGTRLYKPDEDAGMEIERVDGETSVRIPLTRGEDLKVDFVKGQIITNKSFGSGQTIVEVEGLYPHDGGNVGPNSEPESHYYSMYLEEDGVEIEEAQERTTVYIPISFTDDRGEEDWGNSTIRFEDGNIFLTVPANSKRVEIQQ